jgi:excisionase family DNA binding protein
MRSPNIKEISTIEPEAAFSVLEAAALLGMSHNGVLMRIKRGHMRAGKMGSRYFILGSEIQKQITLPVEYDV